MGVGRVRPVEQHGVERVAVSVQVGWRAELSVRFLEQGPTTTIGHHILEGGVDGRAQLVRQGEAALTPDVAGVRRIDVVAIEVRAAGIDLSRTARNGARRRTNACAVIDGNGVGVELSERRTTDEVVAVLIVVEHQAHKVAVAQLLIEAAIELHLVDAAGAHEQVVGRLGCREVRGRAEGADSAGVNARKDAAEILGTALKGDGRAHILLRLGRDVVDRATGCGCSWAIDVGGAEIDGHAFDQFGVQLLVRIDRIVAGVVQRDTVLQQGDTLRVKAAQGDVTTSRAVGIVIGEVDAGKKVDRVQNGLARDLSGDEFLIDRRARLGGALGDHLTDDLGAALALDHQFLNFSGLGPGGLREGGRIGKKAADQNRHGDSCTKAQRISRCHESSPDHAQARRQPNSRRNTGGV